MSKVRQQKLLVLFTFYNGVKHQVNLALDSEQNRQIYDEILEQGDYKRDWDSERTFYKVDGLVVRDGDDAQYLSEGALYVINYLMSDDGIVDPQNEIIIRDVYQASQIEFISWEDIDKHQNYNQEDFYERFNYNQNR